MGRVWLANGAGRQRDKNCGQPEKATPTAAPNVISPPCSHVGPHLPKGNSCRRQFVSLVTFGM
jgi:hypothetical protein